MTDETEGGAAAAKKTKVRWQYFGRSLWPWRKDKDGKSLFLRHAEYRTVPGDFFDGYEYRRESPQARAKRHALDAKLAAKAAKASAPKKRGPYKKRAEKTPAEAPAIFEQH